ncbi:MAG: tetratricopeptide repeat protein, partial [Gemmatimonadetes bacterium]|nr:tetratricopeptide repeat protein [Gemmatimonadota bacterium]
YALLSAGNLQAARRVFELNAESYPQSWNVYDSLGEALKALGETEESIAMYEKSLEINPGNQNARAMLSELRGT